MSKLSTTNTACGLPSDMAMKFVLKLSSFINIGYFVFSKETLSGKDFDEFEFELIDFGLEDFAIDDEDIYVYTSFTDFGTMQKQLEDMGVATSNAELQYIPNSYVDLTEEQAQEVLDLVERLEGDDDVQNVYHNLR